jgi:hypothetical protein
LSRFVVVSFVVVVVSISSIATPTPSSLSSRGIVTLDVSGKSVSTSPAVVMTPSVSVVLIVVVVRHFIKNGFYCTILDMLVRSPSAFAEAPSGNVLC